MKTNPRRIAAAALIAPIAATAFGALPAPLLGSATAHAALPMLAVVTSTADDLSEGSLRSAISAANSQGGDWTIRLTAGSTYVVDRQCGSAGLDDNHGGDLDLTSDGTIRLEAVGTGQATIEVRCEGERVLDHLGTGTFVLNHIRVTGGNTDRGRNGAQNGNRNAGHAASGGGIRSAGAVRLEGSTVSGNRTGAGGSGAPPLFAGTGGNGGNGGAGAAIHAVSVLAIDSSIVDNVTGDGGPGGNALGAGNAGGAGGHAGNGAIAAQDVELVRSLVQDNATGHGGNGGAGLGAGAPGGDGGDGGSGAGFFATTATVDATTLISNQAGYGGAGGSGNGASGGDGGDGGRGGALSASTAEISRSSVLSNVAGIHGQAGAGAPAGSFGAVGRGGGVLVTGGNATISFSTVVENVAEAAANLDVSPASVVTASIVGMPLGGGASCSGFVTSGGYNAADTGSCGVGATDALVTPLPIGDPSDLGGWGEISAPMVAPTTGSALDGMIPAAACAALVEPASSDQRGEPRPAGDCEPGAVELAPDGASAYVALPPTRVFDTREPGVAAGYVGAGETRTVQFGGVAGIPASGVTAVAFNLTLDATAGAGYVTVSPTGAPRPFTSSINAAGAGQTVPNLVIVPLGAGGKLDFYVQRGTHLVADAVGYFTSAAAGARGGRIVTVPPVRAFDTRQMPGGYVPAGGRLDVQVTGLPGVPTSGVRAVVLNLTGTEAGGAGYVTAWAAGQPQPWAASLNLTRPGHTAGNMTIVPVGADGRISIFSQSGAHFVGDVAGYVTDDSADFTTAGLFVPTGPGRWFDTREAAPSPWIIAPGETRTVPTPHDELVPAGAGAVVMNLTGVDPVEPGFVTGWPSQVAMPLASSLNLDDGALRGNAAILQVGLDGAISFYSNMGTHLVADAYGYLVRGPLVLVAV